MTMTNETRHFWLEVVGGVEGPHIAFMNLDSDNNGTGCRLCGPKAWGGGTTLHKWRVEPHELIKDIAQAAGLEVTFLAAKDAADREL